MENLLTATGVMVIGIIMLSLIIFMYFIPLGLWVTAYFSGVRVKLIRDLMGMRLRKVPPVLIIRPLITAHKAGIFVDPQQLEAHYLAGGQVQKVVNALISADKANIDLTFERATAIDLAGRRSIVCSIQIWFEGKQRLQKEPDVAASFAGRDTVQLQFYQFFHCRL